MMFTYKGKNSDPFHLGNYRGIAVDNLLLKLWSLVLNARLERFLENTGGLSAMQGGFRKARGPPESVIALTETVRATTTTRTQPDGISRSGRAVELVFIDVKVAYDSVLHPLLWKRCIDKGVGGHFLAALQAIYHDASAVVHADGELLAGVPLLRGVLQGNPLSPVLFNLYIDGAIDELRRLRVSNDSRPCGLWLPRPTTATVDASTAEDYMQCLFFADDGTLMESDHQALQNMLDTISNCLAELGLEISVVKTKWMLVPPSHTTPEQYMRMREEALKNPITVYGKPIELVEQFDYLGVRLWWRWDSTRAWKLAECRARAAFFSALAGGWQRRGDSLAAQLEFARATIFSHFTYIAAIAGACGTADTAPWRVFDDMVERVLRTITGIQRGNITALKMEAGLWDDGLHIHMMVLRLWRKILTTPEDSTIKRAFRLSIMTTTPGAAANPSRVFAVCGMRHQQTWAQAVLAAGKRLDVDARIGDPEALVSILRSSGPITSESEWLPSMATDVPCADDRFRLIIKPMALHAAQDPAPQQVRPVEGSTCWTLPRETSRTDALNVWSPELKDAMYASIRVRGSRVRNEAASTFLNDCTKLSKFGTPERLQGWAATLSSPFLQQYWYLPDVGLAKWILKARLDQCPTEDFFRTRPQNRCSLPRLERHERACYLCAQISPDYYRPETLAHTLLLCDNAVYLRRRRRFVAAARALYEASSSQRAPDQPVLNFDDNSVLFTILQLCTGVGSNYGPMQRVPIAPQLAANGVDLRLSPQLTRDSDLARRTIAWYLPLLQDWVKILNDPRRTESPLKSPGCKLALLVARHVRDMFALRKSALAKPEIAPAFLARSRDPPRAPPSQGAPASARPSVQVGAANSAAPPVPHPPPIMAPTTSLPAVPRGHSVPRRAAPVTRSSTRTAASSLVSQA